MKVFSELLRELGAKHIYVKGGYAWWSNGEQILFYGSVRSEAPQHLVWVYPFHLVERMSSLSVHRNGWVQDGENANAASVKPMNQKELEEVGIFDISAAPIEYFRLEPEEGTPEAHVVAEVYVSGMLDYLEENQIENLWVRLELFDEIVQLFTINQHGWPENQLSPRAFISCDAEEEWTLCMKKHTLLPYLKVANELQIETITLEIFNGFAKWKIKDVIAVLPYVG